MNRLRLLTLKTACCTCVVYTLLKALPIAKHSNCINSGSSSKTSAAQLASIVA